VLGRRALNRATLARQLLLERTRMPATRVVEHLVGMQAQNPLDPYYGLWARVEGFQPEELSDLIAEHGAVRSPGLRATIHLVTAGDARSTRPILGPVLARTFGSTSFARDIEGLERGALLDSARAIIEESPRTRAALGPLLADLWPGRVPNSLAMAATYLMPVVQVPPRGMWQRKGAAAWTTMESWLGRPLDAPGAPDELILRYLAAFGPAAKKDMRVWSGLAGLTGVVERLRPRLLTFRDESGAELFDLPEAPRPDPQTPAPVRFLPEYDNLLLSHSDRSRFFDGSTTPKGWVGNLLVDGMFAGSWKITRTRGRTRLEVSPGRQLNRAEMDEATVEGYRLLASSDPADYHAVVVITPP
jgi:Winged helix DNA-binding domain